MSSIHSVNVGGNPFGITDSSNIAPIQLTNFASRPYAKDRCFIMADGLLYRATVQIESGDPIVINGNCRRTTLDEIISVIETDSDLIAPTEDGATSSDDYVVGDEIVRSGILYNVISAISEGDAFAIDSNIAIAGTLTSQINTLLDGIVITNNELGAKNYVHISYQSQTINGLTINVDANGRISISGTANSDTAIEISDFFITPYGKNTFTIEQPTGNIDAQVIVRGYLNTTYVKALSTLKGTDTKATFTNDYDGYNQLKIILYVKNGTTINTTLGIMVCPSNIVSDTFAPYAKTNRELSVIGTIYEKTLAEEATSAINWRTPITINVPNGVYVAEFNASFNGVSTSDIRVGISINSLVLYDQFETIGSSTDVAINVSHIIKVTNGTISGNVFSQNVKKATNMLLKAVRIA